MTDNRMAEIAQKLKCNMAQHVAYAQLTVVPPGQLGAGMTIGETCAVQAEYDENSVTVTGMSIIRVYREDEPTLADMPGTIECWLKNNRLAESPQLLDVKNVDGTVGKAFEIFGSNGLSTVQVILIPKPDGSFGLELELADWIKQGIQSVGFRLAE